MSKSTTSENVNKPSCSERTVRLISPGRFAITQPGKNGQPERTAYLLAPVPSEIGGVGYRLFKIGRQVDPGGVVRFHRTEQYDVLINGNRSTCTCPDFTYRGHVKGPCKHIKALQVLQDLGKLDAPAAPVCVAC